MGDAQDNVQFFNVFNKNMGGPVVAGADVAIRGSRAVIR
jgi:hypothetical protein